MHNSNSLPPFDGLLALFAAAELGSFTAAADALDITHGSVSRRIAQLELWLGTKLFERHGRGVRLTPAGQRFTNEARLSLANLSRSAEQWRPWRGRQTLRLSVVPSFARLWLIPRLAMIEGSDIHIDLVMDHKLNDLDAREADISIRYGGGNWDGCDARVLFHETLTPCAAPALARQLADKSGVVDGSVVDGRAVDGSVLLDFPLLHDSDVSHWRAWLNQDGIAYRPRWQDRRFEDYDAVLVAAGAGLGIAMLRLPTAAEKCADLNLQILHQFQLKNPAAHYVCTGKNERRTAVLELADRLQRLA